MSIDVKGLTCCNDVEILREKVYAALEEYTRTTYPEEPGRFAKLLLRLPALRSIGLKCLEYLFLFKVSKLVVFSRCFSDSKPSPIHNKQMLKLVS